MKPAHSLPADPSFAELVCYYLPTKDWYQNESYFNGTAPICAPETSIFDKYHYRLLEINPDCNNMQLEMAWKEWCRLGKYKRGEDQRKNLFSGSAVWIHHRDIYNEIKCGLYGSIEDQEMFREKWMEIGIKEASENAMWETFESFKEYEMNEETKRPLRDINQLLFPNIDPEKTLGYQIYE
jgi:hypothetical protein